MMEQWVRAAVDEFKWRKMKALLDKQQFGPWRSSQGFVRDRPQFHDKSRRPGSISCWWPGERHCFNEGRTPYHRDFVSVSRALAMTSRKRLHPELAGIRRIWISALSCRCRHGKPGASS